MESDLLFHLNSYFSSGVLIPREERWKGENFCFSFSYFCPSAEHWLDSMPSVGEERQILTFWCSTCVKLALRVRCFWSVTPSSSDLSSTLSEFLRLQCTPSLWLLGSPLSGGSQLNIFCYYRQWLWDSGLPYPAFQFEGSPHSSNKGEERE